MEKTNASFENTGSREEKKRGVKFARDRVSLHRKELAATTVREGGKKSETR